LNSEVAVALEPILNEKFPLAGGVLTDTRSVILAAGLDLFATGGYAAVSTRELAAACGVNIATLNYHFGGKESLYRETMRSVYTTMQTDLQALLPGLLGAPVRSVLESLYYFARSRDRQIRLFMREVMEFGHLRQETQNEHWLPTIEMYGGLVAAQLGLSELKARQLLVTTSFLVARFAIQSEESLVAVFGVSSVQAAHEAAVDCLFQTTKSFLEPVA
jgi:AcrR family transcriptional regulator